MCSSGIGVTFTLCNVKQKQTVAAHQIARIKNVAVVDQSKIIFGDKK